MSMWGQGGRRRYQRLILGIGIVLAAELAPLGSVQPPAEAAPAYDRTLFAPEYKYLEPDQYNETLGYRLFDVNDGSSARYEAPEPLRGGPYGWYTAISLDGTRALLLDNRVRDEHDRPASDLYEVELRTGEVLRTHEGAPHNGGTPTWVSKDEVLLADYAAGVTRRFSLQTGEATQFSSAYLHNPVASPDGSLVWSEERLFDQTGRVVMTYPAAYRAGSWSADSRLVASDVKGGVRAVGVQVTDVVTRSTQEVFRQDTDEASVSGVVMDPAGTSVYLVLRVPEGGSWSAATRETVSLLRIPLQGCCQPEVLWEQTQDSYQTDLIRISSISADGRYLSGTQGNRCVSTLECPAGAVFDLAERRFLDLPVDADATFLPPRGPEPCVQSTDGVARICGDDRYATAAQVALRSSGGQTSAVVYLATGRGFADALAGGPLAAAEGSPILLTDPHSLPVATATALKQLAPSRVTALGGQAVLSDDVLTAAGRAAGNAKTDRIAGPDRFATAAEVASRLPRTPVVYLANGLDFPDALAGGAVTDGASLLLTAPGDLPKATRDALAQLRPERLVALGGPAALSADVLRAAAEAAGATQTSRLAGSDRYETATRIAATVPSPTTVYISTGSNFPDALGAAPAAARSRAPIVLTTTDVLPDATLSYLEGLAELSCITILGGPSAVSTAVETRLRVIADGC